MSENAETAVKEGISQEQELKEMYQQEKKVFEQLQEIKKEEKTEALGESGIGKEQIDAWKKQYGIIEAVTINGQIYVYRGIGRLEYSNINKEYEGGTQAIREEVLTERGVLYPKMNRAEFATYSAGIPSTLAEKIMFLSGFVTEEEVPVRL